MKAMIVKRDKSDVFFNNIKSTPIFNYYSKNDMFFKICFKYKLSAIRSYIKEWLNKLLDFDTIILFDNGFCDILPKIIKKKHKNIRIILWYWNPITDYSANFINNNFIDEFWTYSQEDAKKYNINYNAQFYSKLVKINNNDIVYDIVYLGTDKGREENILKYKEIFDQMQLKTNFNIIKKKEDYISYNEYIDFIGKSKCLFEFLDEKVQALTLRTMESIFLEKKLITNNKAVMNYDFYNKNNIFILNVDDLEKLNDFVNSPYIKISQEIINKYDFEEWLKRFEKDGGKNE